MRLFTSFIAMAVFAFASAASADLIVDITSADDTLNLTPGQQFTIDIALTTTTAGEARGVSLRAANWNAGDLTFISATIPGIGGLTPNGSLFGNDLGGGFIVQAIGNQLVAPVVDAGGANPNVNLFQGLTLDPTAGAGPDVFTVTFEYNGGAGNIEAGVLAAFLPGDAYVSAAGGGVTNGSIGYAPIPEPGTALLMGLGLAGLASAGRKR